MAPAGENQLGGRDVVLGYYGSTAATSYEQRETRFSIVRGPDGAPGPDKVVPGVRHAAIGFSDLDGDGTDEWFFDGRGGSGVAKRDDSVVWVSDDYFPSLAEYWHDPAYTMDWIRAMRDLNGDAVPDRLEVDFDGEDSRLRRFLRSGATGQPVWFDDFRRGSVYFEPVQGLAGPDGEGIVEVRVDLPEAPDDGAPNDGAMNLANHTIALTLRSGEANEPRWSVAIHEPNWTRESLFATELNVEAGTTSDTTRDGSPDIVLFVRSPDCGSEWSDCPAGPAQAFSHTYVVDGASGRLIARVPPSLAPETTSTAPAGTTDASAALAEDAEASPGIGVVAGCAALVAAGLLLARRQKPRSG
ncbi:MAG: hypothetical protein HYT80_12110 [Euryarchaeota archaeon]|nr:hypothetical protein [Euryarchaeota archaeon]